MCKFRTLGVSWPPKGWKQLNNIGHSHGQAIIKDPASAMVTGLHYEVDPIPTYHKDSRCTFIYKVQIAGWEYNIHNESRAYPVLSFTLHERADLKSPKHYFISDIRTEGQIIRITERSAHRSYIAALFMMKQIAGGQVPDVARILRLYKIHPSQRSIYDVDNERHDSLFCGITNIAVGANEKDVI